MTGPDHREASEYEALEREIAAAQAAAGGLAPSFELLAKILPTTAIALSRVLASAAGGRVAFVILAARVDDALKGNGRSLIFSNECLHNRRIMLEGAHEITVLELAGHATGGRS